ncbi:helix-turn-helix domain-containing protein [Escherichia coli]|uniref:helix-turn-helix domain-containing protein n=1 Tax=Escherichia coli TaxID=562 RepID=UPI002027EEB6|nr:helix-turn-helix domain-containing protein [Escherichia coli]
MNKTKGCLIANFATVPAAARARGRVGGRKPSLSEEDVKQIRILLADPEMTVGAVAKRFNVSRMTIYRYTTKS